MTDDSGKSTEQLIKEFGERAFKSQYEFKKKELEMETDLSPEEIDRIAEKTRDVAVETWQKAASYPLPLTYANQALASSPST